MTYSRPQIFCSKCITFERCRWNNQIIASDRIESLKPFVDFFTLCPEKDIGLGIPRDPIRLVEINNNVELIQPKTAKILTEEMKHYTRKVIQQMPNFDGIILKTRSPSCGIKRVIVYKNMTSKDALYYRGGIFGSSLNKKFSQTPISDEGSLINPVLWENFLLKIFTLARFREATYTPKNQHEQTKNPKLVFQRLSDFHTHNKYLLMAFSQQNTKILGSIIGKYKQILFTELMNHYRTILLKTLQINPTYKTHLNVLEHILGYFKKDLSTGEKLLFIQDLQAYREGRISLMVPVHVLKQWIMRFDQNYLKFQTYLDPFPINLIYRGDYYSKKEKKERNRTN